MLFEKPENLLESNLYLLSRQWYNLVEQIQFP